MSFLANLEWRRAEKGFAKPSAMSPVPDIQPILNAIVNAPSSFGIQPYVVKVVTSEEVKKALLPACYEQPQVEQCTHLLVFCTRNNLEEHLNHFIAETNPPAQLEGMMRGALAGNSHPVQWAKHQTYLALGFALAAAAEIKIASCPMEGFSSDGVGAVLGLPHSLVPTALLAIGLYDSSAQSFPRFRFPQAELVQWITETPNTVCPIKSRYRHATPVRRRKTEKIEDPPQN
jgi:nitroreductase